MESVLLFFEMKHSPSTSGQATIMKAWKWHHSGDMRMVTLPKPQVEGHEALIRVEALGVCGSDIHYYRDGRIGENMIKEPTILGHEYAGIVEEVGTDASPALLGKRVAVEPGIPCGKCEWCLRGHYNVCSNLFFPGGPGSDGALCEYMTVDSRFCFPVPETMTAGVAAMIEPAAVAVHTAELGQLKPGDTVAIFGLGVVGMLTAQVVRACGAVQVLGVDVLKYRSDAAQRYGIDASFLASAGSFLKEGASAIAWIMEQTGSRGVDVAIDCTNSSDGLGLACAATRPAGSVVLTGISGEAEDMVPVSITRRRELTLHWCRRFLHNYPAAIAMINTGRVDAASLITHVFPFETADEAFALTADYADNVFKASIEW